MVRAVVVAAIAVDGAGEVFAEGAGEVAEAGDVERADFHAGELGGGGVAGAHVVGFQGDFEADALGALGSEVEEGHAAFSGLGR